MAEVRPRTLDVDYGLDGCEGTCDIPGFGGGAVLVALAAALTALAVAVCGLPGMIAPGLVALDALIQLKAMGVEARDHWLMRALQREHQAEFDVRGGVLTVTSGRWTRRIALRGARVTLDGRAIAVEGPSGARAVLLGRDGEEAEVARLGDALARLAAVDAGASADVPPAMRRLRDPER